MLPIINVVLIYYSNILTSGSPVANPKYGPDYQSFWLQIQRSGFDFRHYQIFWEVVGLERGSLTLVSTIEELLQSKITVPDEKIEIKAAEDPPRWLSDNRLS
jgi:hypothetical protein